MAEPCLPPPLGVPAGEDRAELGGRVFEERIFAVVGKEKKKRTVVARSLVPIVLPCAPRLRTVEVLARFRKPRLPSRLSCSYPPVDAAGPSKEELAVLDVRVQQNASYTDDRDSSGRGRTFAMRV